MNLGKVVAVHPEQHSVDILILDDGRRLSGVPVVTTMGSSSSGLAGLVAPESQNAEDPFDAPSHSNRDLIAVVGFYGTKPVVLGFLFPEVSQCLFADLDRYMNRTASDVYWTVDGLGNAELFHPSGAYVRFGTAPEHEDLTGQDFDGAFNTSRNTANLVNIHVAQAGNKATVNIAPDGEIMVTSQKNISVIGDAQINLTSTATMNFSSSAAINVNTQDALHVVSTNPVTVNAPKVTVNAALVEVPSGDVTAGGVSLKNHTHGGVTPGGGNTAKPN